MDRGVSSLRHPEAEPEATAWVQVAHLGADPRERG